MTRVAHEAQQAGKQEEGLWLFRHLCLVVHQQCTAHSDLLPVV